MNNDKRKSFLPISFHEKAISKLYFKKRRTKMKKDYFEGSINNFKILRNFFFFLFVLFLTGSVVTFDYFSGKYYIYLFFFLISIFFLVNTFIFIYLLYLDGKIKNLEGYYVLALRGCVKIVLEKNKIYGITFAIINTERVRNTSNEIYSCLEKIKKKRKKFERFCIYWENRFF